MVHVVLDRGDKFPAKVFAPEDPARAAQRAFSLSELHGDATIDIYEEALGTTIYVRAASWYN